MINRELKPANDRVVVAITDHRRLDFLKELTLASLRNFETFGDVAAEDDSVLEYFLKTDAVHRIGMNKCFLVLGRKGSGKTALVRYFSESADLPSKSRALKLRGYPWTLHASRKDGSVSEIESFVASWRYLIAMELSLLVMSQSKTELLSEDKEIRDFLKANYGGYDVQLNQILKPARLQFSSASIEPTILGNKLGSIKLDRAENDKTLGLELNAVTDLLLNKVKTLSKKRKLDNFLLHFDELDQGMSELDGERKRLLIGLILAARDVRLFFTGSGIEVNPVVYLRSDIWSELQFSDKNKISQTHALNLEWNSDRLMEMIEERLKAKLSTKWDQIEDDNLMRGSQPKWKHIIARTFLRPRDVIKFLNSALEQAKKRQGEPLQFTNTDLTGAKESYSSYLKGELDDEIVPHWKHWDEALQAFSSIGTITFDKDQFVREYSKKKSSDSLSPDTALQRLFEFSVVGLERRSGYGGATWIFQYTHPESRWDNNAQKFKVHPGLKEYARLREDRVY